MRKIILVVFDGSEDEIINKILLALGEKAENIQVIYEQKESVTQPENSISSPSPHF